MTSKTFYSMQLRRNTSSLPYRPEKYVLVNRDKKRDRFERVLRLRKYAIFCVPVHYFFAFFRLRIRQWETFSKRERASSQSTDKNTGGPSKASFYSSPLITRRVRSAAMYSALPPAGLSTFEAFLVRYNSQNIIARSL